MHRSAAKLLLLFSAATCSLSLIITHALQQPQPDNNAPASCVPHERAALLAFREGITEDPDGVLASWQRRGGRQDCCRWRGVTCSNRTGHVLELRLAHIPTKVDNYGNYKETGLVGEISPYLLSLKHLEYLDLSWNSLQGSNGRVPEFLGSFKNLRHLDLYQMPFSGEVPPQLGNLSKLEYLDLSCTSLSGIVPPQLGNLSNLRHLDLNSMQNMYSTDISWLTRLRLLEYLDMSHINLSTVVDLPLVVNTIPSLEVITLINCSLPSANQSLAHLNLTKLEQLDLSWNYFGHPIASGWFWNLTSIKFLSLAGTYLDGPFPNALGGMTSLKYLYFIHNGNAAAMTVDLTNLCELETLWLDGCLLSANITEFLEKLPQCPSNRLLWLSLAGNNMTGMLPKMMKHLTSLSCLNLFNNSITGVIPTGVGNFTSLRLLDLSYNRLIGQMPMLPRSLDRLDISANFLSGPLPLDIGAPNLTRLLLFSNYITGHVPVSICELQNLVSLDLSNNFFEGQFPRCSSMPNMFLLLLSNNSFSGNFPTWLQNCSTLFFLDLAWNKFYGTLPAWIGDFAYLRFLRLSHNMFYGDIPVKITNLRFLQHLDLAGNNISGSIPWSLSNLTAMTVEHPARPEVIWYTTFIGDKLKGILSIVTKQHELKYSMDVIFGMVAIDLSLIQLTGGIPDEISSLKGVVNLNLSWNHLSGEIPGKIGAMESLESLDLSRNNLSGEIPPSLSDISYLSYLDVSYNNLSGKIPPGRQLDTLYTQNPSMYDGNDGLCGAPLPRNCLDSNAPEHGNQKTGSERMFFYFGLGSGFVVGLWMVLCALLFKKTWRIAYFHLFDKAYDKVYVFVVVTRRRFGRDQATTS